MSDQQPDVRVGVITGDGVVIRTDDTLVVVGEATDRLIDGVRAAVADHEGDDLVRALARLALAEDEPPPLAVANIAEDTVPVFLHGAVALTWPAGRAAGTDHVLGVTASVERAAGFTIARSEITDPEAPSWNDLDAGTVAGGGVLVEAVRAGASAAATTAGDDERPAEDAAPSTEDEAPSTEGGAPSAEDAQPASDGESPGDDADPETEPVPAIVVTTDPEPADAEPAGEQVDADAPFEAIPLTGDADLSQRVPLPISRDEEPEDERPAYERTIAVIGVYSPRGFFNHPDAKYCSRTGVKMGASMTKVLTEGPRPPLGVLTLDDGSTLTVRWPIVIGRDPSVDELVRTQQAAPFVVSDIAQSVSRRHALLELIDWDVFISDLGSRNSTYLQDGPDAPLRQLAVGERVQLHSGTIVHLGKRSFVYHEHHVR